MKETLIGRIVLQSDGQRIVQPISNTLHAQRMIDHQQAQREFMEAATAFMTELGVDQFKELKRRYEALTKFD